MRGETLAMSHALEIQNLTDETAYDFFGAQRPGRAAYYKLVLRL